MKKRPRTQLKLTPRMTSIKEPKKDEEASPLFLRRYQAHNLISNPKRVLRKKMRKRQLFLNQDPQEINLLMLSRP